MKKAISLSLLYFLLIVYIYSIAFQVFPISLKIILELFSAFFCLFYFFSPRYHIRKEYIFVFYYLGLLVLWDLITCFLNGQYEFHLSIQSIKTIGSVFAVQLIYKSAPSVTNNVRTFLFFLVFVILTESLLTLFMKISPSIYGIVESILVFDFGGFEMEDIYDIGRFTGIGTAKFFGVLPSCAIGLMSIVYLLRQKNNLLISIYLYLSWIIIFVVSFFTARYSIVVGVLSVFYYLYSGGLKSALKTFFAILSILLILVYIYSIVIKTADDQLIRWAFGAFEGDSKADNPTETLMNWWFNTEMGLETFIIGDARYVGDHGVGYYKNVDVGFLRQIFYCGIIGFLLLTYTHYKILKLAYKSFKLPQFKHLTFFLLLSYLAILTKGDTNMMSYFILYMVIATGGVFKMRNNEREKISS